MSVFNYLPGSKTF